MPGIPEDLCLGARITKDVPNDVTVSKPTVESQLLSVNEPMVRKISKEEENHVYDHYYTITACTKAKSNGF